MRALSDQLPGKGKMGNREVLRFPSAAALAAEGARILASIAAKAVRERGSFTLALSGGSSPIPLYRELATGAAAHEFPWTRTRFFFGDERCVPPSHSWSNFASARGNLFDLAPKANLDVHRIQGELGAEMASQNYRELLAREPGEPPVLDVVLLGLGHDGHTASLFPGDPALGSPLTVAAVSNPDAHPPVQRVTMTLRTINASRTAIFLVPGRAKESILHSVLHDPEAIRILPAAMVQPSGTLYWLASP